MPILRDLLDNMRNKKRKFREAQEEVKIHQTITERQKNSNERELERFIEEKRQVDIKEQLEMFRKQRQKEGQETTILNGKNIFKGHKSILDQPNIFANQRNLFANKGGMFFK